MSKTKIGLEDLTKEVLFVLKNQPGCEGASSVSIDEIASADQPFNWAVVSIDSGSSGEQDCIAAIRDIEPALQAQYELLPAGRVKY